jgi:hypothetical protein
VMDLHEQGQGQGMSEGELSVFSPGVGLSTSVDTSRVNLPPARVGGMPLIRLRSVSAAPSSSVFGLPSPEQVVPPALRHSAGRPYRQKDLVLTSRDMLALRFTSRYQYATYPQLNAYLGMSPTVSRRRMPRLKDEGLFTFESVGADRKVWVPTALGVDLSGLDLPVPHGSDATARHSLALVDLGVRLEQAGEQVVTERELRAADARCRPLSDRMIQALALIYPGVPVDVLEGVGVQPPLFAVVMGNGKQRIHRPDMVLARPPLPNGSPGSVAIEVELTRKERSTWAAVFAAYARAPHIGSVWYYTDDRGIAKALMACVQAMNLGHKILVKKLPEGY